MSDFISGFFSWGKSKKEEPIDSREGQTKLDISHLYKIEEEE